MKITINYVIEICKKNKMMSGYIDKFIKRISKLDCEKKMTIKEFRENFLDVVGKQYGGFIANIAYKYVMDTIRPVIYEDIQKKKEMIQRKCENR